MKRILCAIFGGILALVTFLPLGMFAHPLKKVVAASGEIDLQILATTPAQSFALASGEALLSNHTPIKNFDTGARAEGNALKLLTKNASFNFEPYSQLSDINELSDKSVFVWVFVPTTSQSAVKISLSGTNGTKNYRMEWIVEGSEFYTETETKVLSDLIVPGWRILELPFSAAVATIDGNEDTPVRLSYLTTFEIEQTDASEYLRIFDCYVADGKYEQENPFAIPETEQGDSMVAVPDIFWNTGANSIYGDRVVVPTFQESFLWAWVGENQLANQKTGTLPAGVKYKNDIGEVVSTTEEISYEWKMRLTDPNGVSNLYTFGEKPQTYELVGTYRMQLVLIANVSGSQRQIAQAGTLDIKIANKASGVWFETFADTIDTKYEYSIEFSVDNVHWSCALEDIEISSSNEKVLQIVSVEYNGKKGYIKVRGKKDGKATISLSAECVRTINGTGQTKQLFESKVTVTVKDPDNTKSNKVFMIVLGSVLGATVLAGLAIGIVAIVKHNKMGVK